MQCRPEPLHVFIVCNDPKGLEEAKNLATNLIDTVRDDYKKAHPQVHIVPSRLELIFDDILSRPFAEIHVVSLEASCVRVRVCAVDQPVSYVQSLFTHRARPRRRSAGTPRLQLPQRPAPGRQCQDCMVPLGRMAHTRRPFSTRRPGSTATTLLRMVRSVRMVLRLVRILFASSVLCVHTRFVSCLVWVWCIPAYNNMDGVA